MKLKLIAIAVSNTFGGIQAPRPMFYSSLVALALSKARAA
jgi:hypothetical protein